MGAVIMTAPNRSTAHMSTKSMVDEVDDKTVVPITPRGAGEPTPYHNTQQGESNKQCRAKEAIHNGLHTVSFQ